ncbi:MAG: hypothetical protein HON53_08035 [Planctomycetaceae bacterium]|jgi:hypothetical protein|nr:hypothetical protein [Planctomycetaceae bacterium]MBT6494041.1 hypothetical protein [Planctomycetaceae bacterium]
MRFDSYCWLLIVAGLFFCAGCSEGQPSPQPMNDVIQGGDPLAPGGSVGGGNSGVDGDSKPIVDPSTGNVNAPSLNHGTLPVVDPVVLPE